MPLCLWCFGDIDGQLMRPCPDLRVEEGLVDWLLLPPGLGGRGLAGLVHFGLGLDGLLRSWSVPVVSETCLMIE